MTDLLNILMLHNYYQNSGGEDVSMASEINVLRRAGHIVELLQWDNKVILSMNKREKASLFLRTTWNPVSKDLVFNKLKNEDSDLLHVQNFFPQASPAVYAAARQRQVPIIQHLRNFRLGCLNSYLFRNNGICEMCVGHNPWRGILHRCYRNSLPASVSLWKMISFHRWRNTWNRDVDAFITPSQFSANKLIEFGIPSDRMYVKPNFIDDPLLAGLIPPQPQYPTFLFVGRLSPEKGLFSLLSAWSKVNEPHWKFQIVGTGPEKERLEIYCQEKMLKNVTFLGEKSSIEVMDIMMSATAVLVPSRWYETFGRVVVEAFACGRPAIVSNLGALAELVTEGKNGFLVPYSDENAWAERIKWCGNNQASTQEAGEQARKTYLQNYTPQHNYDRLIEIYRTLLR